MSLVAWYKFDGDNTDSIGNNSILTLAGSYIGGKTTNALNMSGGGSGLIAPSNSGIDFNSNVWSITVWVKADLAAWIASPRRYELWNVGSYYTVGQTDIRLGKHSSTADSRNIYLGVYENQVSKGVPSGHTYTDAELGDWIFISVRCDGATLYHNSYACQSGTWRNTSFSISWDNITYPFGDSLFIGGYGWDADSWTAGINDFRVYNNFLSKKEMLELAKAKVLHYTFNDFQEPKTNYLSDGISGYNAFTLSNWNGDGTFTEVGTSELGTPIFRYATAGSSYRYTHDYVLDDDLTTLSSKKVTFSLYVRRVEGDATCQLRIYDDVSGYSYFSIPVTTQFQRISGTKTLGASPTRIFVMIDNTGGGTYEFHSPQLEQNEQTPFINGSRTGMVSDVSGYGNDSIALVESTTPQWTEDSKLGSGAYYFNGVVDYIQVSKLGTTLSLAEFTNCTLTFWRKNDTALANWLPFVGQDGNYWIMATSGGTGTFYHNNAGSSLTIYKDGVNSGTSVTPFTDQLWHHYAVKGVDLTTWTRIKLSGYGGVWNCEGTFDDIRLYNTPLSDNDIAEIANVKVQLDNTGNLFLNEIVTNGIKADTKNLVHYEFLPNGIYSSSQTWNSDITSQYITYTARSNYRLIQTPMVNPVGDIDIIQTHVCDVTFYTQYFCTHSYFYFNNVDVTKTYRFSQWIYCHKESGTSVSQTNYLGIQQSTVCNLNTTTVNTNPYMNSTAMNDSKLMEKWVLEVFYIYPYGSTGNPSGGMLYYLDGTSVGDGTSFNWASGITSSHIRQYHMYQYGENQAGSYVSIYRPRMEIVDGNEPTIEELINCSVHRVLVDDSGDPTYGFKSIDSNGVGKFDDLSEVGITDGLVGYWKLDGDAKDYSGKGNDGVVTGATPSSGWKNGAYNFEYTTDKIEIGSIGGLTDEFAISCIFNSNTITNDQNMVSRNGPYFLGIRSSKLWGGVYAGATWAWLNGSTTLLSDTWYFACLTYDGVNAKIYLNALLEDTEPQTGTVISNGALRFGYTTGGADEPMDGKIGDVRLYNRVPTIEEIITQYKYCLPTTGMQLSDMGTLYVNKEIIEGL